MIQKSMTAVTIGDRKYTAVDVDYYYYSSYSTYANYASTYGLDTSKPLDEQEVYDGYTWDQMLKDSALKMLANVSVLYQEAQANGYELSQDGQDQVEIAVNNVASYASVYNIDEDYYLQRAYGKYMNAKEYERIYTEYQTAQEYAQYKGTSFDVNEDEIQSYYNEHSNALDTIDYNCYLVSFDRTTTDSEGNKVDLDDATIEANRTEAEAHAQEILDALVAGDKDKAAELTESGETGMLRRVEIGWAARVRRGQAGKTVLEGTGGQILADGVARLYACLTECRFVGPLGLAAYAELSSMAASLMLGEWFD